MIPYDQVDKTDWVTIDLIWDQEFVDKITAVASLENRTPEDWIAKVMYEWFHKELESGQLQENYTKIEIPLSQNMEEINHEN